MLDFTGFTLDLVQKELRMTVKNHGKLLDQITEYFVENQGNLAVTTKNLEKFLGMLNFAATMTHLGRTKTFYLMREFLGAKDRKEVFI